MKTETFHLELITPCFCGGAEPEQQAEIRAPSIRGQLRWWFRTLGGFKSLAPMSVREQEAMIFGTTAGDEGQAGRLTIRLVSQQPKPSRVNADDLNASMNTPIGYALFPLRRFGDSDGRRGVVAGGSQLNLKILWRGNRKLWQAICQLVAVWGHLGCLGFRGRRSFGALQLQQPNYPLQDALLHFQRSSGIQIKQLDMAEHTDPASEAARLLRWYRSWRQHGQMARRWIKKQQHWEPVPEMQKIQNRHQPGFPYARRDHNEGLVVQGTGAPNPDPENPLGNEGVTFRPALGLPIIQFFSSLGKNGTPLPRGQATVNWEYGPGTPDDPKGRFASPVLLRPHRDAQGKWHALVIFVDAHRWPDGRPVYLNGQQREVAMVTLPDGSRSPALYEAMKQDQALQPFTG